MFSIKLIKFQKLLLYDSNLSSREMFVATINFEINYIANDGEMMMVVGNVLELGDWKVHSGLKLECKDVNFFSVLKLKYINMSKGCIWKSSININQIPSHSLEYKYVICKEESNHIQSLRWEEGLNHSIDLTSKTGDFTLRNYLL